MCKQRLFCCLTSNIQSCNKKIVQGVVLVITLVCRYMCLCEVILLSADKMTLMSNTSTCLESHFTVDSILSQEM